MRLERCTAFVAFVAFVALMWFMTPARATEPAEAKPKSSLFAPDTIGAPKCFCPTFTPDGKIVVFVKAGRGLFEARFQGGRWGEAKPLPFSGPNDVRDGDPFLSPDGSRLFFWSNRPFPGRTTKDTDLWVVERRADGWGEPRRLDPPVNNEVNEPFPAVAADGTLYFGTVRPGSGGLDIHRARPSGKGYAEPENLGPAVNSPQMDLDGYIAPDQTILVFGSDRPGGYGKIDLYVSRRKDGRWSPARNLGPAVNGPDHEFCRSSPAAACCSSAATRRKAACSRSTPRCWTTRLRLDRAAHNSNSGVGRNLEAIDPLE